METKTTLEISNYFDDTLEQDFDKVISERWVKVGSLTKEQKRYLGIKDE